MPLSRSAAVAIFSASFILSIAVVENVSYTEIDWVAYMQEVGGFLRGQLDYSMLGGDTGPLVYPAGFVYLFSALYYVTDEGANVRRAQYIFAALQSILTVLVAAIYTYCRRYRSAPDEYPLWVCGAMFLSRRAMSLFVLRLFNDGVQMVLMYCAILLFALNRWAFGCAVFSLSVSIKMNGLLFAPGLAVLLCQARGFRGALRLIFGTCAVIQVVLGLPFLYHAPVSYISRSFEITRQFLHKWSVNGAFLNETAFSDKRLAFTLLVLHASTLLMFGHYRWSCKEEGGLVGLLCRRPLDTKRKSLRLADHGQEKALNPHHVVSVMFTSNFIGIVFARSLHYQFYLWYVHSLPFLVFQGRSPLYIKLAALLVVEAVYNVYPPRAMAAYCLHAAHFAILFSLWRMKRPTPMMISKEPQPMAGGASA